uniref:Uncharacterized protein n=1 Tax=Virus NIOZ-UU159 TaxID=2763270 RepID=A0A7S9SUQ2_9VIRU|nr:MAG: hypothetical protein NIOZUU159_00101 [Virus NIOZ-UU159]
MLPTIIKNTNIPILIKTHLNLLIISSSSFVSSADSSVVSSADSSVFSSAGSTPNITSSSFALSCCLSSTAAFISSIVKSSEKDSLLLFNEFISFFNI